VNTYSYSNFLRTARTAAAVVLGCTLVFMAGCGYRVAGSVKAMPSGIQSLGVPTFRNFSPQYRLEQRVTAAVLKELSVRTRVPVKSGETDVDAVLVGEIRSMSSTPVAFGNDTFASTFLVTVQVGVKLVRTRDKSVLWENPDFLFRERYVLNRNLSEFFSEENPALDRLSREFATSLVSTILNH
jgi:hypothetical protein